MWKIWEILEISVEARIAILIEVHSLALLKEISSRNEEDLKIGEMIIKAFE